MIKNIIIFVLLIISVYYYKHSESLELNNQSLELRLQQLENGDTLQVNYIPVKDGEIIN